MVAPSSYDVMGKVEYYPDRGENMTPASHEISRSEMRLVIAASSAGTVFEWYDFFIYGTLAGIIGHTFFPADNVTLQTLLVWAGFAVGFGFRPLGAVLFGFLGDKLGRKYTFLVTVTLMGIATAGVGLIPSAQSIGIAAPILIILLRVLQGLALGGEYGGAAVYVAEHAPAHRSGYFTSFIQASVVGGFVLSLIVVLGCKALFSPETWNAWAWRVPFLLSLVLLAISLWMRVKLSESPVFRAMKEEGEIAGNPLKESFTYPGNKKRIFVALFGVAAGLTVIWYTAMFTSLSFLKGPMRVEEMWAEIIVGASAALGMGFFLLFGHISDKVGRKKPIIIGYALTLVLIFPIFWMMGHAANPGMVEAAQKAPVIVVAKQCDFDPFAAKQASPCGQILGELSKLGIHYDIAPPTGASKQLLHIGEQSLAISDVKEIQPALEAAGYDFTKQKPSASSIAIIIFGLLALSALSGMTYGPVAALLSEMFPPAIRYSSLSIPYHIGTGYFGGFLPLISSFIVAVTGNPYSGLWYTFAVVFVAFIVALWGLRADGPDAAGSHY
jgi:MFS family permease